MKKLIKYFVFIGLLLFLFIPKTFAFDYVEPSYFPPLDFENNCNGLDDSCYYLENQYANASVVVIYDSNSDEYYAYFSVFDFYSGPHINYYNCSKDESLYCNYTQIWHICNFNKATGIDYRMDLVLKWNKNTSLWDNIGSRYANTSHQCYTFNQEHKPFIYAYLKRGSNTNRWYVDKNTDRDILHSDYNLAYYSDMYSYGSGTSVILQNPNNVYGLESSSSSSLIGVDISSSYQNYYNNYFYALSTPDFAIYNTVFKYDLFYNSISASGNYRTKFILTYKMNPYWETNEEIGMRVYLSDFEYAYYCSAEKLKSEDDITYQWLIDCPSFKYNGPNSQFDIVVSAPYSMEYTFGPYLYYDNNYLFQTNIPYVGISNLFLYSTQLEPTPETPPNDAYNNMLYKKLQAFSYHMPSNNAITNILTLPISYLQVLSDNVNSTCSTYNFGNLLGNNLSMPCFNLEQKLGSTLWHIIDLLISFMFIYSLRHTFVKIWHKFTSLMNGGNDLE